VSIFVAATAWSGLVAALPRERLAQDAGQPAAPVVTPYVPPPEPTTSEGDFGNRTLKGNTFLYPAYFSTAFITTDFLNSSELHLVQVPDVNIPFGSFKLHLVGAVEKFELGIKLSDLVGLRFSGGARAIIGTNKPGFIYNGASYDVGAGLRVPIRLFRSESSGTQLTLQPYGAFSSGQVTTLFALLQNNPVITAATILGGNLGNLLTTPLKTIDFGIALPFAQTLSKNLSLQAIAGVGRNVVILDQFNARSGNRDSNSFGNWEFTFGAALAADGSPNGFPLAAMFEWVTDRQTASTSLVATPAVGTVTTLALGAYYTGRPNLQLGLTGALELGLAPVQIDNGESGSPTAEDIRFVLRYIW
jgi:hypothetical protein